MGRRRRSLGHGEERERGHCCFGSWHSSTAAMTATLREQKTDHGWPRDADAIQRRAEGRVLIYH